MSDDDKKTKKEHELDRREFVVSATSAALLVGAGGLGGCSDDDGPPEADAAVQGSEAGTGKEAGPGKEAGTGKEAGPGKEAGTPKDGGSVSLAARVVEITDSKSVPSGVTLDKARVRGALRAGLMELAGATSLAAAWKVLLPGFKDSMRIGLKVNTINNKAANSPELLLALIETMTQDLGAKKGNIIVWDRVDYELTAAKLDKATLGVTVQATDKGAGGPGYESTKLKVRSSTTTLSKILTQQTDITFDLGVLKDHDIGGITGALKNVYGMIENPGDFHNELGKDLPELYGLAAVRKSVRLCILEGFIAVKQGGPMGPPTNKPGKLLLSTDPVAMDAHALTIINGLRKVPVDSSMMGWLASAAKKGLGSDKPKVVKKTMA